MKTILNVAFGKCMLLAVTLLVTFMAVAQEATENNKVSVNTTTTKTNADGGTWYAAPWVWVVGASVFILLLVAIVRGGGRRAD